MSLNINLHSYYIAPIQRPKLLLTQNFADFFALAAFLNGSTTFDKNNPPLWLMQVDINHFLELGY